MAMRYGRRLILLPSEQPTTPHTVSEKVNKRHDEVTAGTAPTYPPGAPVWVMNHPDKYPAVIRGSFHQLSAGPCVVVEYPDGTIKRHPQDKVRPRAEKKGKA